ncbi:hypothetical protein [Minwuia sp. IMCC3060]|uniref:hypothetical protein n=1 Tax=Minwuia sp. IMCC3060 TaxID=3040675 RepID=UPI00247A0E23|nr:hypothetical protein [Minwuia sp. IMCC3060]
MSVTSSNRKLAKKLRKCLAKLAKDTGGKYQEQTASGGRMISKCVWDTVYGLKSFSVIWHSSVSDRNYAKKITGEIRKKIHEIPGLSFDAQPKSNLGKINVDTDVVHSGRFYLVVSAEFRITSAYTLYMSRLSEAALEQNIIKRWFIRLDAWTNWYGTRRFYKNGKLGWTARELEIMQARRSQEEDRNEDQCNVGNCKDLY